ncbi:MAG: hypothetical protein E3J72_00990 [Planctomycetota bacterium]|nr:MAG: hypothetical protein E3J72_00990 [Planctomycetota bacterium]
MKVAFTLFCYENGKLRLQVAGKFTGHTARRILELLQSAVEFQSREIMLDLRKITSIDSIGVTVLDWVKCQNGNLSVDIFPPVRSLGVEWLASAALGKFSENAHSYRRPESQKENTA